MADTQEFGDFEVLKVLGTGGTATVYEVKWGPRPAALKVIHEQLSEDESVVERFLDEATKMSRLQHPHIVKVLGVGHLGGSRPYLVMELLKGKTLATILKEGPLEVSEALHYFKQIASAVEHLHQQQIIHRDIKPENIIITDGGDAVLLDLGLAKPQLNAQNLTKTGTIVGTPLYMAPERMFGSKADVSTDVYELGLTLYNMLAGKLPWDNNSPDGRLDPVSLSDSGVSVSFENAVMRSLSTRQDKRPKTVASLLDEVLGNSGVMPAAPLGRGKLRRSKAKWLGLAATIVALGGGAIFYGSRDTVKLSPAVALAASPVVAEPGREELLALDNKAPYARFIDKPLFVFHMDMERMLAHEDFSRFNTLLEKYMDSPGLASCEKIDDAGQISIAVYDDGKFDVVFRLKNGVEHIDKCLKDISKTFPPELVGGLTDLHLVVSDSENMGFATTRTLPTETLDAWPSSPPNVELVRDIIKGENIDPGAVFWFAGQQPAARTGKDSLGLGLQLTLEESAQLKVAARFPSDKDAAFAQHEFYAAMPKMREALKMEESDPYWALIKAMVQTEVIDNTFHIHATLSKDTMAFLIQLLENNLKQDVKLPAN